jgi:hypothetical protein
MARHWRRRHGEVAEAVGVRARRALAAHNSAGPRNWETFAGHRDRLTRLLRAAQRGEGLCVLGAGNGDDLDLVALVREFGEVHLVDLDGQALRRARARVPEAVARRLVLHGDVDLTGLLDGVERWGEDDAALAELAAEAASLLAARLGRTFDVVLSSCVLSQLCTPFLRVLARRPAEWVTLMRAVGRTHFELAARLTRPGGTAVVLGDSYYAPASAPAATPTWDQLDPQAVLAMQSGIMRLRDPRFLAELVAGPPVRHLLTSARLSDPWLWHVEDALMLVYAVILQRS